MAMSAMVQVDMALLRAPTSPLLSRQAATASLTSPGHFPPSNSTHFGGELRIWGDDAQRRAGRARLRSNKVCCARASVGEDRRGGGENPRQFPPPGELQYFGKLSAGCVAGALLVKYGSLCVPSVTTPNINIALWMITTPCLVSVVVLALASVFKKDGNTRKQ